VEPKIAIMKKRVRGSRRISANPLAMAIDGQNNAKAMIGKIFFMVL